MDEILRLLARQARWQKSRRSLSWPEKIRMAERIREPVLELRSGIPPGANATPPRPSKEEGPSTPAAGR
jgi:hypothetical protein